MDDRLIRHEPLLAAPRSERGSATRSGAAVRPSLAAAGQELVRLRLVALLDLAQGAGMLRALEHDGFVACLSGVRPRIADATHRDLPPVLAAMNGIGATGAAIADGVVVVPHTLQALEVWDAFAAVCALDVPRPVPGPHATLIVDRMRVPCSHGFVGLAAWFDLALVRAGRRERVLVHDTSGLWTAIAPRVPRSFEAVCADRLSFGRAL